MPCAIELARSEMRLPRTTSIIINKNLPPSKPGSGRTLIKAKFMESNATKKSKFPKPDSFARPVKLKIPTGPATAISPPSSDFTSSFFTVSVRPKTVNLETSQVSFAPSTGAQYQGDRSIRICAKDTPRGPSPSGGFWRGLIIISFVFSFRSNNILSVLVLFATINSCNSLTLCGAKLSIFKTRSPGKIPAFSAGEPETISVIIIWLFDDALGDSSTALGTPHQLTKLKIKKAKKIFAPTPANKILLLFHAGFEPKLYGSSAPPPSSPLIFTKPPNGK